VKILVIEAEKKSAAFIRKELEAAGLIVDAGCLMKGAA